MNKVVLMRYKCICDYKCVDLGPRNQTIRLYIKFLSYKPINSITEKDRLTFIIEVKKFLLTICSFSLDEVLIMFL